MEAVREITEWTGVDDERNGNATGTGCGNLCRGTDRILDPGQVMEALRETTGGLFPAHTYLLDGTTLVAYIKKGETTPFYFSKGIKGFDKRGRTFEKADAKQFKVRPKSDLIAVEGSKGKTYYVDPEAKTCTCQGFVFRSWCKHLEQLSK